MTALIAAYARSPFHFARKGALAGVRPDDLAATVVGALLRDTGADPATLDDVIAGCAYPEGVQGDNLARIVSLLAGLPHEVGGMTVNRFCGSSMSAIHIAAAQIEAGLGEAYLCFGVESMTQVPQGGLSFTPNPRLLAGSDAYIGMGETAENVALRYAVSREDQERFALRSHDRAASARQSGHLRGEIVPVTLADGSVVSEDGCIRPGTSLATLAGLQPAFRPDGVVTAGTSSPLTDGAAAVLVTSERYAARHDLRPLARIAGMATAGVDPAFMGIGPVPAVRKLLARAGISAAALDVVEINEAFAAQALACIRELGLRSEVVNLDGGGLAIGHPLGATGARITGKAAALLQREGGRYALATQCIGGGQGIATLRQLGIADDDARVNPNGGAIALGHPLGMSGARITGKAAALLQREGGRYALATQCIGGGQGIATLRQLGIADDDARVNPNGGAIALGHPLGMSGARITGKAAALLQREGGRYALATQCIGGGQGIATLRQLGIADDDARVNPNGGAIALGHPLGMSGARITGKAAALLQREGGRYALATQCIGGGQGIATLRQLGIADDDARVNPNGGAIALGHPLGMSGARITGKAAALLQREGGRYALATQCIGGGQGIATLRQLGIADDDARVNPNGGAIALGHPLGMSGARITGKAAALLQREGGRYALATQCIGGGQGIATLRQLGIADDDARVNPNGGAIALGHPLGMSGARITGKAAALLQREGGRYALATQCIGGGQGIATLRQLGIADDDARVNPNGGAIALGHPLGMSGARITGKAAALLQREGGRYALATQCIGGGQGIATLRQLGIADDDARVNPNGGAIALGHPLGMSGARITGKAAALLQREGGRYALATQCIGGGQGIATLRQLGIADDDARVNPNGGAIALGHPLGMSGARITGKAAALLQREGGRYALATQCIGGGQGIATLRQLGIADDDARVNPNGGAIALGHPLGMSGARITGKAAALLQREGGRYALATQCIGGGQGIATLRQLGIADDDARVNPNGGAIALGHPLGMSGARITGKAAALLQREGGRYALATQCIGGGQGIATLRQLGIADDDARVNPNGGAIALGHPLGMSGARITGKAAALLQREGGRYALATHIPRTQPTPGAGPVRPGGAGRTIDQHHAAGTAGHGGALRRFRRCHEQRAKPVPHHLRRGPAAGRSALGPARAPAGDPGRAGDLPRRYTGLRLHRPLRHTARRSSPAGHGRGRHHRARARHGPRPVRRCAAGPAARPDHRGHGGGTRLLAPDRRSAHPHPGLDIGIPDAGAGRPDHRRRLSALGRRDPAGAGAAAATGASYRDRLRQTGNQCRLHGARHRGGAGHGRPLRLLRRLPRHPHAALRAGCPAARPVFRHHGAGGVHRRRRRAAPERTPRRHAGSRGRSRPEPGRGPDRLPGGVAGCRVAGLHQRDLRLPARHGPDQSAGHRRRAGTTRRQRRPGLRAARLPADDHGRRGQQPGHGAVARSRPRPGPGAHGQRAGRPADHEGIARASTLTASRVRPACWRARHPRAGTR
ncbi:UNVERIFIED_CONTAM: fadA [Trichonephila clavipes]